MKSETCKESNEHDTTQQRSSTSSLPACRSATTRGHRASSLPQPIPGTCEKREERTIGKEEGGERDVEEVGGRRLQRRGGRQASPAAAARSAVTALVVRGGCRVDAGEARSEEDDAGCRISECTRLALDDDMSRRTDIEKRGEDDGMMEGRRLTTRARGKSQHSTN